MPVGCTGQHVEPEHAGGGGGGGVVTTGAGAAGAGAGAGAALTDPPVDVPPPVVRVAAEAGAVDPPMGLPC